jgi:sigma-B regulation protein RsbU (phosphoserine phosphatase)
MNSVCLFLFSSDRMNARTSQISLSVGSEEAGRAVAASLRADNAKVLLLLPDGLALDGTAIIRGAQEILGQGFVIAGGAAGDKARFVQTYQLCDGQLLSGAMPAMMLYADGALEIGFGVMSGWKPIGVAKTVTSAEGNVVYRIEDETALDLYSRFLGDKASQLPAIGYEFPFGLIDESGKIEQPGAHSDDSYILLRSPTSVDHEKGSVTFAAEIPEGAKVRITMAKTYDVVEGARVAAEQAMGCLTGRPDAVLFFSCSARKLVLGSRTNREIKAAQAVFGADVPMAGFYAYGEIANCGTADPKCRFHNETATFLALREPSASGNSHSTDSANALAPGKDETQVSIEVLEEALAGAERQSEVLEKFCFGLEQEHIKDKEELNRAYSIINAQKERMQEELSVGHKIQMSMIPLTFPAFPDRKEFTLFASLEPAREVGGDFYDFFFIDEDRLCVCIGDVSGKGVPAALFMAVAKTLIKSRAASDLSSASILTHVNDELSRDNPSCMFVTIFLCIVNVKSGDFVYTNAGHNPPYLKRKNGSLERLGKRHGPVIGAMEGMVYKEDNDKMSEGDICLLYTDGVTEAMDRDNNLFSEKRLVELLSSRKHDSVQELIELTVSAVNEFEKGKDQADDITVLALRFNGMPEGESKEMNITIKNQLSGIGETNKRFNEFAEQWGISKTVNRKVNLVFDELLSNIISYAHKEKDKRDIEIKVEFSTDRLTLTISDDGVPFNPLVKKTPDTNLTLEDREIGGLGIHLVRSVMDEITYQRKIDKNVLILTKHLKTKEE